MKKFSYGTTSRNEYTGRLLFETEEKSMWFETIPAKLQQKSRQICVMNVGKQIV
jgi:hypothetical protein